MHSRFNELTPVLQSIYFLYMRTILNISLPEATALDIKQFAKTNGFASVSEYIRYLVREENERQFQKQLMKDRVLFDKGKGKVLKSFKDLR